LMRDVALSLDVTDVPEGRLRVRLTATKGLWAVDVAQADYGSGAPLHVALLRPRAATTRTRRDVRDALTTSDGARVALTDRDNAVDVDFDAPPPIPGALRTVILRSAGYYTIDSAATGDPDPEALSRLVDEPGAYGR